MIAKTENDRSRPALVQPIGDAPAAGRRGFVNAWWGRAVRAALAATVIGGLVLAAPASPTWAKDKKSDNGKFIPKTEEESNVAAYFIVLGGILVGMTAVCRRSYRTTDPKRSGGE